MRPTSGTAGVLKVEVAVGAVVAAAIIVAVAVVVRTDTTGEKGSGLGDDFSYDWKDFRKVEPKLIHYEEGARIDTQLSEPRGLALGADDRVYVAGDKAIQVFDKDGHRLSEIKLADSPRCLALARDGAIYVGMKEHVEVYDREGAHKTSWESRGPKAVFTAVAVADEDVFVADAGNRVVLRYGTSGKLLGRIGRRDPDRNIPGIVIRSPHLDLAIGPEGLLWVANSGRLRLEAYTFRGDLEISWGKGSQGLEGFCGCCNPTNFAVLPDGRFVTSEKGLPRVKVHNQKGVFESVVAGPEQFAKETAGMDLAVDSQGRILVLDPVAKAVRIFARKKEK